MQASIPKPYLRLGHRYLIDVTLERLLGVGPISEIYLALHAEDKWWPQCDSAASTRIHPYIGGSERVDSVRAGLDRIRDGAAADDWVLVHDVARPCVAVDDIERLLAALAGNPVGGLLAAQIVDTVKEVAADARITRTVDRKSLWRALTPQVFRFQVLDCALREASRNAAAVTDEASAVEALGLRPQVISGSPDNIKITHPADLALAEWLLGKG